MTYENLDIKKKELGIKIGKQLIEENIATNYVTGYAISRKQNYVAIFIKPQILLKKVIKKIMKENNIEAYIIFESMNLSDTSIIEIRTNTNN